MSVRRVSAEVCCFVGLPAPQIKRSRQTVERLVPVPVPTIPRARGRILPIAVVAVIVTAKPAVAETVIVAKVARVAGVRLKAASLVEAAAVKMTSPGSVPVKPATIFCFVSGHDFSRAVKAQVVGGL